MSIDPEAFKKWDKASQETALAMLQAREHDTYKPFFCPKPNCTGKPHNSDDGWDHNHARQDQRPPSWAGDWLTFLMMSGRGGGKTMAGSNITHQVAKRVKEMALVGVTGPDLRETMVEGPSGILATAPPNFRPVWEPSRRRLVWPNGAIGHGFSAEEPDRIRGANVGFAWLDEAAFIDKIDEVWMNLLLALREMVTTGNPHVMITTTPRATKFMKELVKDPQTILHRVSTYENLDNLSPVFRQTVLSRFEGTRMGQQELYGEILEDVEGALWNTGMFNYEKEAPALAGVVVSVDPAGSANKKSDETGIIVVGIVGYGSDFKCYVLEDATGKYTPKGWATRAVMLREKYHALAIVVERNYGGDMVKHTLKSVEETVPVIQVDSRKGKEIRATPVVGLYEQGKVIHVGERGDLVDLEDEQTSWIPGESPSPNRIDALVHGVTHLTKYRGSGKITVPGQGNREENRSPGGVIMPTRRAGITQAAQTVRRRSTVAWPR
jgi:phage terminase large subunit-like protein